jgi:hypothetical protein
MLAWSLFLHIEREFPHLSPIAFSSPAEAILGLASTGSFGFLVAVNVVSVDVSLVEQ